MMIRNYLPTSLQRSNKWFERKRSSLQSPPQEHDQQQTAAVDDGEAQPLMMRHISMAAEDEKDGKVVAEVGRRGHFSHWKLPYSIAAIVFVAVYVVKESSHAEKDRVVVIPIEDAVEHTIDVGGNKTVWFRTWGTRHSNSNAVPALLFVHGGPGQAVADYENGNKRFFDATKLFVVEVDQRGTGNSQPSVRDDYHNMKMYQDVSINLIARDFEAIRQYLGLQEWAVWGGSFGSTISLNYCMLYADSCIALLLRGIYLDTKEELSQVYSMQAFEGDERKLAQFDLLYDVARKEVERNAGQLLDPNDFKGLLHVYEKMIQRGDKHAIWMWHSFENNLMEDRPEMQQDPNFIIEDKFPEATSVAFFETRLWLGGSFENPSNLLERVDYLADIPIWMCQGVYDNVCPVQNAWRLIKALKGVHHRHHRSNDPGLLQAYFLDANHEDTDPVMETCLKKIMNEFLESQD